MTISFILMSLVAVQAQEYDENQEEMNEQEMIQGEDIEIITYGELPDDVKTSYEKGDYQENEVDETYIIKGTALSTLINQEAMDYYLGDLPPDQLYVLQITEDGKPEAVVYYMEDGEVYAEQEFDS
jgi:hypothetical protein